MAVTVDDAALAAATGLPAATAERLLPVVTEMIERYAPAAPEAVQNEAAIRVSGWLADSPASGLYEAEVGERSFRLARPTLTGALRSSGAMALLRPYKRVGAGLCV